LNFSSDGRERGDRIMACLKYLLVGSWGIILKIRRVSRFDDVNYDEGYEYRGFNYVIQDGVDEFFVRTYDCDPGQATIVHPTSMYENCKLKTVVEFLQSELGVSSIFLSKMGVGSYEEIDLNEFKI
jgi:hypothetical protein